MTQQLYTLISSIKRFFAMHHAVLFVSFVGIALSAALYFLYDVLNTSNVDASATQSTIQPFDKQTADKIKNLRDSNDTPAQLTFPSSRPDPFVEQ